MLKLSTSRLFLVALLRTMPHDVIVWANCLALVASSDRNDSTHLVRKAVTHPNGKKQSENEEPKISVASPHQKVRLCLVRGSRVARDMAGFSFRSCLHVQGFRGSASRALEALRTFFSGF